MNHDRGGRRSVTDPIDRLNAALEGGYRIEREIGGRQGHRLPGRGPEAQHVEDETLREGRPLIADFGIALAATTAGGERLTETGLSLDTPFCTSPEQATGSQEVGHHHVILSITSTTHRTVE